jgi:hypothetical protein
MNFDELTELNKEKTQNKKKPKPVSKKKKIPDDQILILKKKMIAGFRAIYFAVSLQSEIKKSVIGGF